MKIVIVGAGIAGLSTYLHLRKHIPSIPPESILILERAKLHEEDQTTLTSSDSSTPGKPAPWVVSEATSRFQGGIGLVPNGLRVLRQLNTDLHDQVRRAGYETPHFALQTAAGFTLGLFAQTSFQPTQETTVMMERRALWEVLRRWVPASAIRDGASVKSVAADGRITLATGEVIGADLVVGADGVRSIVRQSVIDAHENGRDADYQNLMNVFGTCPASYMDGLPSSVSMVFGSSGFFGASRMSAERAFWWSTYPHVAAEDERLTTTFLGDEGRVALRNRHQSWKHPVIQKILADLTDEEIAPNGEQSSIGLQTPTWALEELPRWSRGRLCLISDAAHALPPTSGQGASQALEDSAMLIMLLAKAIQQEENTGNLRLDQQTISEVFDSFEKLRKPRLQRISGDAKPRQNQKRDKTFTQTLIMYFFLWLAQWVNWFKGAQSNWRLDYDVAKAIKEAVPSENAHQVEKVTS